MKVTSAVRRTAHEPLQQRAAAAGPRAARRRVERAGRHRRPRASAPRRPTSSGCTARRSRPTTVRQLRGRARSATARICGSRPGGSTSTASCARTTSPTGCASPPSPTCPARPCPRAGNYAVYLDVWERHITAVDQHGDDFPSLLEPALRGPDTATRTRVVWQVRARADRRRSGAARSTPPAAPTGRLRAVEVPALDPTDDCLVPPGGGYRRLENQLYRVEVHDASRAPGRCSSGRATTASMVSRTVAVDEAASTIVVEDEGRDDVLGFASAKWVELSDEERVLRRRAGALLEVEHVAGDERHGDHPRRRSAWPSAPTRRCAAGTVSSTPSPARRWSSRTACRSRSTAARSRSATTG